MNWWRAAGVMGALAVGLGAFGAHGLHNIVPAEDIARRWSVGAHYHLLHSVALLGVASNPDRLKVAGWAFLVGITLFSGSLYLMTLTGLTKLGMITPLGGVSFIFGWLWIALRGGN